jgi:hypothetical protein
VKRNSCCSICSVTKRKKSWIFLVPELNSGFRTFQGLTFRLRLVEIQVWNYNKGEKMHKKRRGEKNVKVKKCKGMIL